MSKSEPLGSARRTGRGFPTVEFEDAYGTKCGLTASSAIGEYPESWDCPGSSFVWLGVEKVTPQIMASKAIELGMDTQGQTVGWVDYPVPPEVLLSGSMHLNREQVRGLIERLQEWLNIFSFEGVDAR